MNPPMTAMPSAEALLIQPLITPTAGGIARAGHGLVDHDRLAYLPYGMVIPFVTPGHGENGTK
jgi:hypothetical protein